MWMLYIFYFNSDSLPSTGWVIYGPANMVTVHQKNWCSLYSPFLHHRLSVALGLLDDDLLLLWKEHLYVLPAGAWWDRDDSVKDCVPSPLTFTTQATDWETIMKYLRTNNNTEWLVDPLNSGLIFESCHEELNCVYRTKISKEMFEKF